MKNTASNACLTIVVGLFLSGCGGGNSTEASNNVIQQEYRYQIPEQKNDGWQVADANVLNVDSTILADMVNNINDNTDYKIDSVTLIHQGKLILEQQFRKHLDNVDKDHGNNDLNQHYMASVTKSITSALLGIALMEKHILSTDENVLDFFSEYNNFDYLSDRKQQVTIEHLLTMRHGFSFDESGSMAKIMQSNDYIKTFLDMPMANEPGTYFEYSSAASIVLGDIVSKASNLALDKFAQLYLF